MENSSDTEVQSKNHRVDYVNRRWSQLYELEKESSEKALKYLLLTNSGGAIATLSFIGASKVAINMAGVKIALILFVIGLLLVGVSIARQYHHMSSLFKAWKHDVAKYFGDTLSWEELTSNDENRIKDHFLDIGVPYASWACFIFGCISGAISLLCGA